MCLHRAHLPAGATPGVWTELVWRQPRQQKMSKLARGFTVQSGQRPCPLTGCPDSGPLSEDEPGSGKHGTCLCSLGPGISQAWVPIPPLLVSSCTASGKLPLPLNFRPRSLTTCCECQSRQRSSKCGLWTSITCACVRAASSPPPRSSKAEPRGWGQQSVF